MKRSKNAAKKSLCVLVVSEDDNPDDVKLTWLEENGRKESRIIEWTGEKFGDQCWIRAANDQHSLYRLEAMR